MSKGLKIWDLGEAEMFRVRKGYLEPQQSIGFITVNTDLECFGMKSPKLHVEPILLLERTVVYVELLLEFPGAISYTVDTQDPRILCISAWAEGESPLTRGVSEARTTVAQMLGDCHVCPGSQC